MTDNSNTDEYFHASKNSFTYKKLASGILHIIIAEHAVVIKALYVLYVLEKNPSVSFASNSFMADNVHALAKTL